MAIIVIRITHTKTCPSSSAAAEHSRRRDKRESRIRKLHIHRSGTRRNRPPVGQSGWCGGGRRWRRLAGRAGDVSAAGWPVRYRSPPGGSIWRREGACGRRKASFRWPQPEGACGAKQKRQPANRCPRDGSSTSDITENQSSRIRPSVGAQQPAENWSEAAADARGRKRQ